MKDLIIRPKQPPSCGTCNFTSPVAGNLTIIECRGLPPTPCITGGQQTVSGPQYAIELLYPRLARTAQGCALWREKTPDFAEQN